ncbi:MAG TPA: hypothetical protein VMZ91_11415 [Candidatus Paceibacterota bacterium]|nr:hypothetical protein [Candidatus Paceibacterota bacterium]
MARSLRSWINKETTLTIGDEVYHGKVRVMPKSYVMRLFQRGFVSQPLPPLLTEKENRYYFETGGRLIDIYKTGERRVIIKDGGLVQITE